MSLTIVNGRVLTLRGAEMPRRGASLRDLGIIDRGFVRLEEDRIVAVGAGDPDALEGDLLDAAGCVVMPAFVDCHTHACWAGDRFDEFEMKLAGAGYLEILEAGGGIMSTVRDVRASSCDDLAAALLDRLDRMAALGTGTVEVKSGYGLETETELRMLEAITVAAGAAAQRSVVPTFLGAHAIDPENPRFVDETVERTLPAVVERFGPIACDAYCERGAWSLEQTVRLFEAAQSLGCPLRVHADQFSSLGMTRRAVEMGAVSVDHLEATVPEDLERLAAGATIGVALPCSGFHLDDRYAPARELVDLGGALAVATNYNPGSSPTPSMPFCIALACRKLRLTPAEAILCATVNAACVLGLQDEVGTLEAGKRADLIVLDGDDERDLAYELATPGPATVVLGGRIVHRRGV